MEELGRAVQHPITGEADGRRRLFVAEITFTACIHAVRHCRANFYHSALQLKGFSVLDRTLRFGKQLCVKCIGRKMGEACERAEVTSLHLYIVTPYILMWCRLPLPEAGVLDSSKLCV